MILSFRTNGQLQIIRRLGNRFSPESSNEYAQTDTRGPPLNTPSELLDTLVHSHIRTPVSYLRPTHPYICISAGPAYSCCFWLSRDTCPFNGQTDQDESARHWTDPIKIFWLSLWFNFLVMKLFRNRSSPKLTYKPLDNEGARRWWNFNRLSISKRLESYRMPGRGL